MAIRAARPTAPCHRGPSAGGAPPASRPPRPPRGVRVWVVVPNALRLRRLRDQDASSAPGSSNGVDLIDAPRTASRAPQFADDDFDDDLMRRRRRSEEDLTDHPLPHVYVHTPKAAGYDAMRTPSKLLFRSPRIKALPEEKQFRICNLGNTRPSRGGRRNRRGTRCTYVDARSTPTVGCQHFPIALALPNASRGGSLRPGAHGRGVLCSASEHGAPEVAKSKTHDKSQPKVTIQRRCVDF